MEFGLWWKHRQGYVTYFLQVRVDSEYTNTRHQYYQMKDMPWKKPMLNCTQVTHWHLHSNYELLDMNHMWHKTLALTQSGNYIYEHSKDNTIGRPPSFTLKQLADQCVVSWVSTSLVELVDVLTTLCFNMIREHLFHHVLQPEIIV